MKCPSATALTWFLLGIGYLSGVFLLVSDGRVALAGGPPLRSDVLEWDVRAVAPIPDEQGFAGSFAGVARDPEDPGSEGVLIVAGGANFPDGRPWEGAQKVWYDKIFVLQTPTSEWQTGFTLPRPLGYGVSANVTVRQEGADVRQAVVCLGGGDAAAHYADVFLLEWTDGGIETTPLPPMPAPAAFFCGAAIGNTVYVAGGKDWPVGRTSADSDELIPPAAMKTFWALDLSKSVGNLKWEVLDPWPGEARMQAVAAVQDGDFFLIGGVALDQDLPGDDKRVFLNDCYRYDPAGGEWTAIAPIPQFAVAAPTPAMSLGQSHFAVVGGDDGVNATRAAELKDDHPGFPADVFAYHTITDTWISLGRFPKDVTQGIFPPVTTSTTWWHGRYVIPTGEARPGVRTPNVAWAKPLKITARFSRLDYAILAVYLASLVGMGVYFSRREKSTGDFFLGGQRIPWWAAGISIFGTQLSAITFMAIPAKAFHTDWIYFLGNMTIVAIAPIIVYLYLPFFRRLEITSAYEYLEKRFNLPTRLLGSGMFMLFQLGRMGIVLYLPALALSTVTGINVYSCILMMGALATLYTVLGGIEAVIWTDVLQVFVLLGGAILSVIIMAQAIDGGFTAIVAEGLTAGKLKMVDLDWSVTSITTTALWVVLLGKPFESLISYTSDQTVVQRYLTTPNQKSAAQSIWTNALLTIPASIIFFGAGTALWAYYRSHPEMLNPTGRIDDIFPWFISQQLPAGVAGLVIAGLFAAAMSSLDSSMNSMATAATTDFYRRFRPNVSDRSCLGLARWLTVILGVVGTGFACYMAYLNSTSMWDQYSKVIGLFGGGLAGLFAAGIFSRRTTGPGIIVGFVGSAVLLYLVKSQTQVHFFLYPTIGIAGCFAIGYLASLLIPSDRKDLEGLTIFSRANGKSVSDSQAGKDHD